MFNDVNGSTTSEDTVKSFQHPYRWSSSLDRHKKGFQAEVWQVAPHINFTHCIIYREA
jgi:hypothetical protein